MTMLLLIAVTAAVAVCICITVIGKVKYAKRDAAHIKGRARIYIKAAVFAALPAVILVSGACGTKQPAGTGNGADTGAGTGSSDDNRKMDMIVWYDIDNSPFSNDRPEKGWYTLNPQHPGIVTQGGLYRATTPLLGLYDQRDPKTARQHFYWISALGCNAMACDLTNYKSYRTEGMKSSTLKYNKGVYNNLKVLMKTAGEEKNDTYGIPEIYPTVRLVGSDFEGLRMILDDMYTLYADYKDVWYTFDDGSENKDKPFIVIFADWNYMTDEWVSDEVSFSDDRYNIRWSNGHISSGAEEDSEGRLVIPEKNPFWLFVENVKDDTEGYYKTVYKAGAGNTVEQMTCWAAVWYGWSKDGSNWDSMNNIYDGKITFERTLKDVETLSPKALLVNRFNYPLVWKDEPQEGLSLYDSVHIEPNEDFGFEMFNIVMNNLYKIKKSEAVAPPAPEAALLNGDDGKEDKITVSLKGFPLEYRISTDPEMNDAEWAYLNINDWIEVPEGYEDGSGSAVYIQTRNCFGESEISEFVL